MVRQVDFGFHVILILTSCLLLPCWRVTRSLPFVGLPRYRPEVSMLLGRYRELRRTTAAAKSLRLFNPRTSPAELLAMAHVLLIEDDDSISQLLRMIFDGDGQNVLVAQDG